MTVPNLLTYFRILLIPAIVGAFYLPGKFGHLMATAVFVCAALTDWIDGYLARYWHQTTRFGAFLDPVADKLVVSVALILIVAELGRPYIAIPAAVIIGREIVISALREWMADIGKRTSVAVNRVGKLKTAMQMVAICLLLAYRPKCGISGVIMLMCGVFLLYIAAGLTLWSMFMYIKAALPDLTDKQL